MNNTEALYCFFKWLAEQPRTYMIGGGYHGGDIHGALALFCETNKLPYLEDGWETKARLPVVEPRAVSQDEAKAGYIKGKQ